MSNYRVDRNFPPEPPCEKCFYKKHCIVECQSFNTYVYWGRETDPPKLADENKDSRRR